MSLAAKSGVARGQLGQLGLWKRQLRQPKRNTCKMPQSNDKAIAKRCHLQTLQTLQYSNTHKIKSSEEPVLLIGRPWEVGKNMKKDESAIICPVDTTCHADQCFLMFSHVFTTSWALDSFSDLIRQGSRKVSNDISTQCLRTRGEPMSHRLQMLETLDQHHVFPCLWDCDLRIWLGR